MQTSSSASLALSVTTPSTARDSNPSLADAATPPADEHVNCVTAVTASLPKEILPVVSKVKEQQLLDEQKTPTKSPIKEETIFVKLSDLERPPVASEQLSDTSLMPPPRMTRSIPETSWIENSLLMTRSTGAAPNRLVGRHSRTNSALISGDHHPDDFSELSSLQSSVVMGKKKL